MYVNTMCIYTCVYIYIYMHTHTYKPSGSMLGSGPAHAVFCRMGQNGNPPVRSQRYSHR